VWKQRCRLVEEEVQTEAGAEAEAMTGTYHRKI